MVPPGIEIESVDLAELDLPVLNEPAAAIRGGYVHEHTRRWSALVDRADGFVLVTPEYNHGVPGPLKNAMDYLFHEWADKAIGFVSYGASGGVRAVEQLRQIVGELRLADVRTQVALSAYTDFDYTGLDLADPATTGVFAPHPRHVDDLSELLTEVVSWSAALAPVRAARRAG